MKYWLMSPPIHGSDIHQSNLGKAWPYEPVTYDERLKAQDILYLTFGSRGLYAWGHLGKKEQYQHETLGKSFRITVRWSVVRQDLVPHERIEKERELDGLFSFPDGNIALLTVAQIKTLNKLIRMSGEEPPPDPSEIDEESLYEILHAGRPKVVPKFILGQPLDLEETRYVEFKEVTGKGAINSIKANADVYAVALLNHLGGRVFWGVRDSDRVVTGLSLTYQQRDEIKREVNGKLSTIQPPVSLGEFSLEFYPVQDEQGQFTDLYVFELDVPRGPPSQLYATGSNEVIIKTDSGKQKLNHVQSMNEILRRRGL
jgi:hypothetical protein